jgi:hypothetical protein
MVSGTILTIHHRLRCLFDGGEDLDARGGIEFVPIEAEKEALADSLRCGLWVLLS